MDSFRLLVDQKRSLILLMLCGVFVYLLQSGSTAVVNYLALGLILFPLLLLMLASLGGLLPTVLAGLLMSYGSFRVYGTPGLLLLIYLFPLALSFLYAIEKKLPFFQTVSLALAVLVLSMVLLFILFQRMTDGNLYTTLTKFAIEGIEQMPGRDSFLELLYRSGFIGGGGLSAEDIYLKAGTDGLLFEDEARKEFIKQLSTRINILTAAIIPGLLSNFPISLSALGIGLAVKMGMRHQTIANLGMPQFSSWHIPKKLGRPLFLLALGYLLATLTSSPVLKTMGQLMYNVCVTIYGIQGLAFFNHLMKRRGVRPGLRFIGLLLLFVLLQPILMLMGLYDQLADPRKLRTQASEKNNYH